MKSIPILTVGALLLGSQMAFSQEAPLPAVTVAIAAQQQISGTLTYQGRLEADQSVDLIARVPGFLQEVAFEGGDDIAQGDVLFRIEPDQYRAAVRQAEGSLAAAQATVADARIERDRQTQLVQRNATAQAVLDAAEAALGRAQGGVEQAEAALDTAKLNLSYTTISAPFSGRIGTENFDPGALVGPEAGSLARLTKLDPIYVNFSVPTAEYRRAKEALDSGAVSADRAVRIVLANGAEYDKAGVLDFVDSVVNAGTDSVRLRATLENPEGILLDAELVRVRLSTTSAAPMLTVPVAAVQRDIVGDFVMLVNDRDEVEQRRIAVAQTIGNNAIVREGLTEGDRVITEGVNKVRAGIRVDAAEAAATAPAVPQNSTNQPQTEAEDG